MNYTRPSFSDGGRGVQTSDVPRIGGIINEMNNRTFMKERQINNRFIDLLKRIIVSPILDMYSANPPAFNSFSAVLSYLLRADALNASG